MVRFVFRSPTPPGFLLTLRFRHTFTHLHRHTHRHTYAHKHIRTYTHIHTQHIHKDTNAHAHSHVYAHVYVSVSVFVLETATRSKKKHETIVEGHKHKYCPQRRTKYQLIQDHNYVCKVLINSKKKKGMLCNLFVEHCMFIALTRRQWSNSLHGWQKRSWLSVCPCSERALRTRSGEGS